MHRRNPGFSTDSYELECMQLTMLLLSLCHTLIICVDSFGQAQNCIRELLEADSHLPACTNIPQTSAVPRDGLAKKKINLVVVHQLANPSDFHPLVVTGRMRLLEKSLEGNDRFDICGALNNTTLAGIRGPFRAQLSKANYIILGEMKLNRSFRENRNGEMNDQYADGADERYISAIRIKLANLPRDQLEEISEVEW